MESATSYNVYIGSSQYEITLFFVATIIYYDEKKIAHPIFSNYFLRFDGIQNHNEDFLFWDKIEQNRNYKCEIP